DGKISAEQLGQLEDTCILRALDLQKQVGIDVYTEGEYRRAAWSAAIRTAIEGLVPTGQVPLMRILNPWQGPHGEVANTTMTMTPPVAAAKIRQVRRLTDQESAFLKKHAPGPWKITMPGAMSAAGQLWQPGVTDQHYSNRQEFVAQIIEILKREMAALLEEGAPYIQLDSLHYVE